MNTNATSTKRAVMVLLLVGTVGGTGCDSLLEVENPNAVVEEKLQDPAFVSAYVNGALALTTEALGMVAVSTAALSDELTHTGSKSWARELDRGIVDNPAGRADELFDSLAAARWMSDEALEQALRYEDDLDDPDDLARAYLYSGVVYMTIADNFEDFVFSDREVAAAPVGENEMDAVYDTAIARLDAAADASTGELSRRARATQARAEWAKALWPHLQAGNASGAPLISDPEANALAAALLTEIGVSVDWAFNAEFTPDTDDSDLGFWVNEQGEFQIDSQYVVVSGGAVDHVSLSDPIDGGTDPALEEIIEDFLDASLYPTTPIVTARELHLILAEAALAGGSDAVAVTHINHVRALKGATLFAPVSLGGTHPQSIATMLRHERRTSLFFMPTRRFWDMVRFGERDPRWGASSDAVVTPGRVLPIGLKEQLSNCRILGTCGS